MGTGPLSDRHYPFVAVILRALLHVECTLARPAL